MPKRRIIEVDEQVLTFIGNATKGVGIEDLLAMLGDAISRRSLQRRLSELVDAGRLITEGGGRSTRYHLPKVIGEAEAEEDYVRLSPSGADVRQLVRRAKTERTPVGYKREVLDQYRPNESSYLTPETISQLARIGATPDESDRRARTLAIF